MTKASFLLSCLLLASNTAMAGSSPPPPPSNPPHDTGATQSQPIRRAEPSVARAATSTRHVSLDRAVAAPRRFVLEPAGEEQVLHVLQAHVDSQTETRDGVII
ncbi:MAG: hypothetical protein LBB76_13045, partial [Azoarcus sp.]|nr:hypothetical protein [Azoarcus sp.]